LANAFWPRKFRAILADGGLTWGNAQRSRWARDDRRAARNGGEEHAAKVAALTLQEISRKNPGVENGVAQKIEEAITARAFGWIDDAISASTIALRRRRSGVGTRPLVSCCVGTRPLVSCCDLLQNIAMATKERFPASYVESVGRSGQDVRLA